jgi:hypothetical protein
MKILLFALGVAMNAFSQDQSSSIHCTVRSSVGEKVIELSSGQCVGIDDLLTDARQNFLNSLKKTVTNKKEACDSLKLWKFNEKETCSTELKKMEFDTRYLNSQFSTANFSLCSKEIRLLSDLRGIYIPRIVATSYSRSVTILERYALLPQTVGVEVGVKISSYKENFFYDTPGGELPQSVDLEQADFTVSCK